MIEQLLKDSPIVKESVIKDVRELTLAGEYGLAFDTLCSWIYEDELPIEAAYYDRLRNASIEFGARELVDRLGELVLSDND
ncbi:MafI family immunity protein [Kibdelosporangium aridum]|uniref:MafI family immunity protein n=1 Tax=Kibdelosporangium aridum TaxID=2030 RepID=UPI001C8B253E|nr:MafI family immunity protein [Kibdelosporangium aridum]